MLLCSVRVRRLSWPQRHAIFCSRRLVSLHMIHKYIMHICLRVGALGVSCYFHSNFILFCSSGTMTQHDFTVYGARIRWRKNRVDRAALNRFALIRYSQVLDKIWDITDQTTGLKRKRVAFKGKNKVINTFEQAPNEQLFLLRVYWV